MWQPRVCTVCLPLPDSSAVPLSEKELGMKPFLRILFAKVQAPESTGYCRLQKGNFSAYVGRKGTRAFDAICPVRFKECAWGVLVMQYRPESVFHEPQGSVAGCHSGGATQWQEIKVIN